MRIQIFTQFYFPEIGATQTRLRTFAEGLAARGHEVDVVCEVPNHPQGIIHPGWRSKPVYRRRANGVTSWHVWVYARPEKSPPARMLFYGSYAALSVAVGSALPRPDLIFASSPPLPVGAAAALTARRHRRPWVLDVRDLWPEAAVAVGELSGGRLLRWADDLAQRLYESAAVITVTTEPFRAHIAARVSNPEKVHVLPNGTTRFWLETADLPSPPTRPELGLARDRFVCTFAGNVGRAQGLEAAIDAAKILDDRFQVVILGDGPARRELEERASGLPDGRVVFRGQVSPDLARGHLHVSDCLLVTLAAHPSLSDFVPSKLFDFCAAGRPVVLSAGGEAQRLAGGAGAVLGVPPGDPGQLASAIVRLRADAQLRQSLVNSARRFAEANLRDRQVTELDALLDAAERK